MRFQMLIPRCQGSPTQENVDRHRAPAASRCIPTWPPDTGSSNNFARTIGRIEISKANTMFPRVADTMECQPILNDSYVPVKSNMDAQKPEVVEFT